MNAKHHTMNANHHTMNAKHRLAKTLCALAVLLLSLGAPSLYAQQQPSTRLTEGTVVRVRLLETLDSGSRPEVGDLVTLEVADAVTVGGITLIRQGARATGTITESKKAKWGGRKGKLDFTIDYVEAVDGQNVRTRSSATRVQGKGNVGLMAAGAILVTPVAVLVRGKNAVIKKGTEFSIYVDQDRDIAAGAAGAALSNGTAQQQ